MQGTAENKPVPLCKRLAQLRKIMSEKFPSERIHQDVFPEVCDQKKKKKSIIQVISKKYFQSPSCTKESIRSLAETR